MAREPHHLERFSRRGAHLYLIASDRPVFVGDDAVPRGVGICHGAVQLSPDDVDNAVEHEVAELSIRKTNCSSISCYASLHTEWR